jgi:hypothetical protein
MIRYNPNGDACSGAGGTLAGASIHAETSEIKGISSHPLAEMIFGDTWIPSENDV